MIFKFTRREKEDLSFIPVIPPAMARFTIPDSRGLYASGEFGAILFYEIDCPGFSIRYGHYIMKQTTHLFAYANSPALDLHFALHNRLRYRLEGLGEVRIPESHFNITYAPYVKNQIRLEAARHYTILDIDFARPFIEKMVPYFPMVGEFLHRTELSAAGMMSPQHNATSTELQNVIYNLLHCDYTGDIKTIYLQYKVEELLLMSLYKMN